MIEMKKMLTIGMMMLFVGMGIAPLVNSQLVGSTAANKSTAENKVENTLDDLEIVIFKPSTMPLKWVYFFNIPTWPFVGPGYNVVYGPITIKTKVTAGSAKVKYVNFTIYRVYYDEQNNPNVEYLVNFTDDTFPYKYKFTQKGAIDGVVNAKATAIDYAGRTDSCLAYFIKRF